MKRTEYLEYKSRLYEIYNKWVKGIERTEQDFKDFFIARQQVCYYEGSRRLRQQKNARISLELVARDNK